MQITNVDMSFDDLTEDLALDEYHSLLYHSGADTPANAVVRRLSTPEEGYARMIRIGSEAKVYNPEYYSALPTMLSAPGLDASDVQAVVELASAQDGRITPIDFAVAQDGSSVHSFTLSYLSIDNEIQSITTSI